MNKLPDPPKPPKLPKLPGLLASKIYKTGQTRGADSNQVYQNRVARNSTVLIPLSVWNQHEHVRATQYENGFIVLVPPADHFERDALSGSNLELGVNALVFYERRQDWDEYPLPPDFKVPRSRKAPLKGHYLARIADTTSDDNKRINHGFTGSKLKGAGIRQFEYADKNTIKVCRLQLEAMFWLCVDAEKEISLAGMKKESLLARKKSALSRAEKDGLLDYDRLEAGRVIDSKRNLICPLCKEELSAAGFLSRVTQASGRERHDATITEVNLFHIEELGYEKLNHRPYNLGWGHHHCNVVCKDNGIENTLRWMQGVLDRNKLA